MYDCNSHSNTDGERYSTQLVSARVEGVRNGRYTEGQPGTFIILEEQRVVPLGYVSTAVRGAPDNTLPRM